MALTNTLTRYGSVTKTLHWITALGILAVIQLGIIANGMAFDTPEALAAKAQLFSWHKTIGVTLFFVALARIAWATAQPKPVSLHPERRLETFLASTVHWLLYGSLVFVPLSGWIHHAATEGFAPIWWPFGQSLPFVPKSPALAETFAGLHIVFERVLVVSLILHIAGAIKHHVVDKDATLRRMLPGQLDAGVPQQKSSGLLPPMAALGVWVAALGIGSALGVFAHEGPQRPSAALAEVASDWRVQDGTLSIEVRQFGAAVEGTFTDWTAAISYDEARTSDPRGTVEVTVAIGSLTLGSVTSQALGADYFDAATFPTAVVAGDIVATNTGLVLNGTLTIKEQSEPMSLPFDLTLESDTATATGELVVDRRAFGIGMGMTDEGQLAFPVTVRFELTAVRGQLPTVSQ